MDDVEAMRELAHETWSEYFEAVSKEMLDAQVSIDVGATPGSSERREAQPMKLQGLTYDGSGDVFEVSAACCGLHPPTVQRHLVDHPERVLVNTRTVLAPITIRVDGQDGVRTVIMIEDEPALTG